jgi:hypothetical protein
MPKYTPIHIDMTFKASLSDLVGFQWKTDGIIADFMLPDDNAHDLRVTFDRACIVRLLDEMPLSTEHDLDQAYGMIAEHFAYRVEGSSFAETQSSTWKLINAPAVHYRFATGWTCMDVLSAATPAFNLKART